MKRKAIFILSFILVWELGSRMVNNDLFLPSFLQVSQYMAEQLTQVNFLASFGLTVFRLLMAFVLSLLTGIIIFLLPPLVQSVLKFVTSLLRVVPTAALILILVILLPRENALLFITWIVIMPIMVDFLDHQNRKIQQQYKNPLSLYGADRLTNFVQVILPLSLVDFLAVTKSTLLIGLKIIVSSEILVSIQQGIGRQLYLARIDINMIALFGQVLFLILFSFFLEGIFTIIIHHVIRWLYH